MTGFALSSTPLHKIPIGQLASRTRYGSKASSRHFSISAQGFALTKCNARRIAISILMFLDAFFYLRHIILPMPSSRQPLSISLKYLIAHYAIQPAITLLRRRISLWWPAWWCFRLLSDSEDASYNVSFHLRAAWYRRAKCRLAVRLAVSAPYSSHHHASPTLYRPRDELFVDCLILCDGFDRHYCLSFYYWLFYLFLWYLAYHHFRLFAFIYRLCHAPLYLIIGIDRYDSASPLIWITIVTNINILRRSPSLMLFT